MSKFVALKEYLVPSLLTLQVIFLKTSMIRCAPSQDRLNFLGHAVCVLNVYYNAHSDFFLYFYLCFIEAEYVSWMQHFLPDLTSLFFPFH